MLNEMGTVTRGLAVVCSAAFVALLPSASVALPTDAGPTRCDVTPSVRDYQTPDEDDFIYLGAGAGYLHGSASTVPPVPPAIGPFFMGHQSIFQATCSLLANRPFTLRVQLTFERCTQGCQWSGVNAEPLVCEVTSVGHALTGWVATLEVPGPDCFGGFLSTESVWPSTYRVHMILDTFGPDVSPATHFDDYSLPYVGV